MDWYLGDGYKKMTGEYGPSTKNLMEYLTGNKTKAGTYHWDDVMDPANINRVMGHGAANIDGALPHLQIHQIDGKVILVGAQGHIVWQSEYDSWRNQVEEKNPSNLYQPIRMPGLHYNRYRYYDPTLGRYITQDPIGLLGGMNVYNYPLNPLQYIDFFRIS